MGISVNIIRYLVINSLKNEAEALRALDEAHMIFNALDDIKMPIEINKRKCTVQPGCDSVSTKDVVIVDGQEYTVNLYDMDL